MIRSLIQTSTSVDIFYVFFIGENGKMKLERKTKSKKTKVLESEAKIEDWMVPSVNIIVIAHSIFGEFIFDATKVHVIPMNNNAMKTTILPERRKSFEFRPGHEIEIKLSVDEKNDETSTLHLLSVDERVRYFGDHNDITTEKLDKLLAQYYEKRDFLPVANRNINVKRDQRYDDLSKFNAFFMTNAYIDKKDCSLLPKSSAGSLNLQPEVIEEGSQRFENINTIIREDFPETFLFEDIGGDALENKEFKLKKKVPHSITSFLVNGFVFHPEHGLGIAEEKQFTVIKEFFTKVFAPHSIHIDEVMKLNVAAYNYFKASIDAKITVEILQKDENVDSKNHAVTEFVRVRRNGNVCQPTSLSELSQTKTVKVLKDRGTSAYFFIRANSPGSFRIKITASASGVTDVMIRTLKVEPHGTRKSKNFGHFIDLTETAPTQSSNSFDCEFPNNILNYTKKVYVTAYGNILGQALTGVDKLVKQPTGGIIKPSCWRFS